MHGAGQRAWLAVARMSQVLHESLPGRESSHNTFIRNCKTGRDRARLSVTCGCETWNRVAYLQAHCAVGPGVPAIFIGTPFAAGGKYWKRM